MKSMLCRILRNRLQEGEPNTNNAHRRQKHNRFFDSVSLRYLFTEGERHEVKPQPDRVTEVKVMDESGNSTEAVAKLSGSAPNAISPSLEVHYQSHDTMTVEHSLEAWRCGMGVERCKLLDAPSATQDCQLLPFTNEYEKISLYTALQRGECGKDMCTRCLNICSMSRIRARTRRRTLLVITVEGIIAREHMMDMTPQSIGRGKPI